MSNLSKGFFLLLFESGLRRDSGQNKSFGLGKALRSSGTNNFGLDFPLKDRSRFLLTYLLDVTLPFLPLIYRFCWIIEIAVVGPIGLLIISRLAFQFLFAFYLPLLVIMMFEYNPCIDIHISCYFRLQMRHSCLVTWPVYCSNSSLSYMQLLPSTRSSLA